METQPISNGKRLIITLTVITASILELIDTSIVNVALSQIAGNLGATIEDTSWVVTAYAIANVIIIPMTGFLAKYFGRKNYYAVSIVIFTISSLMCGTSTSLVQLVLWRFIQGIGGGALLATSQAILYDAWPIEKRGLASGLYGMGLIMGPTIGPALGGVIVDHYAWHWIFNINIPVGIAALLLTLRFVDKQASEYHINRATISIDYVGISLLAMGVGALQYVLERGESDDWFDSRAIVVLTILFVVSTILFIWWELRNPNPVLDLRVFKNRNLAIATILSVITGLGLYGSVFIFPVLAQRVLGYTPTMTGVYLIPGALTAALIVPNVGRALSAGVSPIRFIAFGYVIYILMSVMFARTDPNATFAFFIIPILLRGIGLSFINIPLVNQSVQGLTPREMPYGIAATNMMRQLGGSLGIAIMNTYVAQRFAVHRGDLISMTRLDDPLTTDRLNALTQSMIARGINALDAPTAALRALDNAVSRQAYLVSYNDAFLLIGVFFLCTFPLIFLLRAKKMDPALAKAAADAAH